jgi:hypothetical protein
MGLDQYAYTAAKAGQQDLWWEGAELNQHTNRYENSAVPQPHELAYWRKHPNLQGWMEGLWREKCCPGSAEPDASFNGIELELTWADIERLEQDILSGNMASLGTRGFFFGDASDDYYREQDLAFCREARAQIFLGVPVFYNSSW